MPESWDAPEGQTQSEPQPAPAPPEPVKKGEIILYVVNRASGPVPRPAIVVEPWNLGMTPNMYVFPDGSNDGYNAGEVPWRTSVSYAKPKFNEVTQQFEYQHDTWHHIGD